MLKRYLLDIPFACMVGLMATVSAANADDAFNHKPTDGQPLTNLWNNLGLEFTGYFRAGTGANTNGGKQECYQLPGAAAKERLGNECQAYGELQLGGIAYKGDDGSQFDFHTMIAYQSAGQNDWEPNTTTVFRQAWVQGKNLFDGSNVSFWAGKRYYRREDIHQMDFFYWDPSGTGGGFEDLNLGLGKLAYAFFHQSSNESLDNNSTTLSAGNAGQDRSVSYHDVRLYDIPLNKNGLLTIGADVAQGGGSSPNGTPGSHGGFMATIQHNQKDFIFTGASNKLAAQYGEGAYAGVLAQAPDSTLSSDYHGVRVIDYAVADISPEWSVGIDGIYENKSGPIQTCTLVNQFNAATGATTGCTKQSWYSAEIRPMYHITRHFALQFDVGHDIVKPDGLPQREMTKFTFAPTLTVGRGYWDRPQIRLFVTHADWNKAARDAGLVTFDKHGMLTTETNGTSFGVQTEIWW